MQKLTIKKIAEFRGKSEKSKRTFVRGLNRAKSLEELASGGGGDYWVSCISALIKSYRENDLSYTAERITELQRRRSNTSIRKTRDMYDRNVDILSNYGTSDLKRWRPAKDIDFPRLPKRRASMTLRGLEVQIDISHIFTFNKDGFDQVGCIWFIAKLDGFQPAELGMFASIMHRYLRASFSRTHKINAQYCIAVDVFKKVEVNYSQLEKGEVPDLLEATLEEIKRLL